MLLKDNIQRVFFLLKELRHGILSYFDHRQNFILNWRKPENNTLQR